MKPIGNISNLNHFGHVPSMSHVQHMVKVRFALPAARTRRMVRMSPEEHEALKIFSFHSGISINEVMLRAMRNFLGTEGKSKEFDAVLRKTRNRYRNALDKLEES